MTITNKTYTARLEKIPIIKSAILLYPFLLTYIYGVITKSLSGFLFLIILFIKNIFLSLHTYMGLLQKVCRDFFVKKL
jgi:hypothetical protein